MTESNQLPPLNDELDLEIVRFIDALPEVVWQAWTDPEQVKKWWAPKPWTTEECEIDLRAGGSFRTVMRSPEGEEYPVTGIYLEVTPNRRITFTDALDADLRPASSPFFTAIVIFEAKDGGTQYTARALHKDQADRTRHEEMGFHEGWGAAAAQLAQVAADLKQSPV